MPLESSPTKLLSIALLGIALSLSLLAGFNQVKAMGLGWQEEHYLPEMELTVSSGGGPGDLSAAAVVTLERILAALHLPRAGGLALVAIRVGQNLALLLACFGLYRRLGLSPFPILLGWMALTWSMTHATYQSTLAFDVYSECLLCVLVVWAVCARQDRWCVPLCAFAALNHDTGWLVPLSALAAAFGESMTAPRRRRALLSPLLGAVAYVAAMLIRHSYLGDTAMHLPMLRENLGNAVAWGNLAATFGMLPFLAALGWRRSPLSIQCAGAAVMPVWFAWQFTHNDIATTHVFLAPIVVAFLPAALFGLQAWNGRTPPIGKDKALLSFVAAAVLFMAVFTVWHQMTFMGLSWYEHVQWERTQQVMRGESGTPWQYRLLTESIVTGVVKAYTAMGIPRPVGIAFITVRLVQNTAVFSLALYFFSLLGIPLAHALLGIGLLGWGMGHALYDGDLTFNTYTDMSFFLIAGSLIITGRIRWLVPLMCLAPFNRETSGCIPFMLLFARLRWENGRPRVDREALLLFVVTLALWASIVGGLRLVFGLRPYIIPTAGVSPILPLLTFNLTWWRTWVFLFATFGILPLLALASWKHWPPMLRHFFFAVAPVWFPLHFMLAHAPETRLFLVPHVLLFVPGALLGLGGYGESNCLEPAGPEGGFLSRPGQRALSSGPSSA